MSVLLVPLHVGRVVLSFLLRLPAAALMFAGSVIWALANWVSPTHSCGGCEADAVPEEPEPSASVLVIPDRVFRKMMRRGAISVR